MVDEILAREYGWLPCESDEMDWQDIVMHITAIKKRWACAAGEKIREYMMWVNIIHSTEPEKLVARLDALTASETSGTDNEVGDMAKLRQLKHSGGKVRTDGGGGR